MSTETRHAALIFIDANQYLNLYRTVTGKKLLGAMTELQQYVFLTVQLVQEVQRNKLQVAKDFLAMQFEKLSVRGFAIPDQLFNAEDKTAKDLEKRLSALREEVKGINTILTDTAGGILERISRSEDEVSGALAPLFRQAIADNEAELVRARQRKERGNPPGKKTDALGDQLSWEQVLTHCKDKSKLWIISNDSDYSTKSGNKVLLNPFLYDELKRLHSSLEVFCFSNLDEGLRDFAKVTGIKAEKLPTLAESKAIKEELEALPSLDVPTIRSTSTVFAPTVREYPASNLLFTCPNCKALIPRAWFSFEPPMEAHLVITCHKCGWSGHQKASEGRPI